MTLRADIMAEIQVHLSMASRHLDTAAGYVKDGDLDNADAYVNIAFNRLRSAEDQRCILDRMAS